MRFISSPCASRTTYAKLPARAVASASDRPAARIASGCSVIVISFRRDSYLYVLLACRVSTETQARSTSTSFNPLTAVFLALGSMAITETVRFAPRVT